MLLKLVQFWFPKLNGDAMLIHIDGFDSYKDSADAGIEYLLSGTNTGLTTNGGRFGGGGISIDIGGYSECKRFFSPLTQLWVGFGIKISGTFNPSPGGNLISFISSAGAEFSISYFPGTLTLWRGFTAGTNVATISTTIDLNTWHWIEFFYSYGTSAGSVQIWVDGIQIGSTYVGNTTNSAGGSINCIAINDSTSNGTTRHFSGIIDDLYILDATQGSNTTRLGDCRVETLVPASNGTTNNGTPSAGSNWQCVNEAQWNTTNYVTITGNSGQEELYNLTSLTSSQYVVYGIRNMAIAEKLDAGPSMLKTVTVSNGSENDSSGIPTLTNWARQYSILETDPHTSAMWTANAINSMQVGVKVA